MSFKFEHSGKKFWAKEVKGDTELYLLEIKGLAEKLGVLPGKFDSSEEIMFHYNALKNKRK